MTKGLSIIILILTTLSAFGQQDSLKQFVILTFETDRNWDSHGTSVYYWIAELKTNVISNEDKHPLIYTLFLHEFYSRNQLDSCCANRPVYPFDFFQDDNFDFEKNYSEYLTGLQKMVKNNRVLLQKTVKIWKDNHKETIIVYGTAVRGQVCRCVNAGNRILKPGDEVSFPKGQFQVIKDYWTNDKWFLTFMDFSMMEFVNTDYPLTPIIRTGK